MKNKRLNEKKKKQIIKINTHQQKQKSDRFMSKFGY